MPLNHPGHERPTPKLIGLLDVAGDDGGRLVPKILDLERRGELSAAAADELLNTLYVFEIAVLRLLRETRQPSVN